MNRCRNKIAFFIPTTIPFLFFFISLLPAISSSAQKKPASKQQGGLKIHFINTVNGLPLVLHDSSYSNPFNEVYTIHKLKYYISNVQVIKKTGGSPLKEKNSYHLVDAGDTAIAGFRFSLPAGSYTALDFVLGVDSLHNCSGAQTGALDPTNDMFWTWNSGYVMFKLEGSSALSNQVSKRIEYHIGGYAGANNVIKKIRLSNAFEVLANSTTEFFIEADINKLWQQPNEIKITEAPVCTTPGALAKKIADNYSKMFSFKKSIVSKD